MLDKEDQCDKGTTERINRTGDIKYYFERFQSDFLKNPYCWLKFKIQFQVAVGLKSKLQKSFVTKQTLIIYWYCRIQRALTYLRKKTLTISPMLVDQLP